MSASWGRAGLPGWRSWGSEGAEKPDPQKKEEREGGCGGWTWRVKKKKKSPIGVRSEGVTAWDTAIKGCANCPRQMQARSTLRSDTVDGGDDDGPGCRE